MSTFHLILDPYGARMLTVCPDLSDPAQQAASIDVRKPADLATQIEQVSHALTADELAGLLAVSRITVFKQAAAGRIPSFRVGTCVRFDPKAVANWLRKM